MGGDDHTVRIWDSRTGSLWRTVHGERVGGLAAGQFSDGRPFLAVNTYHALQLRDPLDGAVVATSPTDEVYIVDVATGVAQAEPFFAIADRSEVQLWWPERDELRSVSMAVNDRGHPSRLWAVVLAEDTGRPVLASAGGDGAVWLTDPVDGTVLAGLSGHRGDVYAAAFRRLPGDHLVFATAGADQTVRLWDPVERTLLHTLETLVDVWTSVVFRYDGDRPVLAATCNRHDVVSLWDPRDGTSLGEVHLFGPACSLAPGERESDLVVVSEAGWCLLAFRDRPPSQRSATQQRMCASLTALARGFIGQLQTRAVE